MATAELTERAEQTAPQIHKAIIQVMRRVGAIAKDQKNQAQHYNFRGIDQVYNAVHPLFAEAGIYSTSEVLDKEITQQTKDKLDRNGKKVGEQTICRSVLHLRYTFYAEDGSSVSTEVVAEGQDYGDKASNKAMSVADKYAILQLLKIPTAMVDSDRDIPREAPRQNQGPVAQPRAKRVPSQEITALVDRWKVLRQRTGEEVTKAAWTQWVIECTGRDDWTEETIGRSGNWTADDVEAVRNSMPEDVK